MSALKRLERISDDQRESSRSTDGTIVSAAEEEQNGASHVRNQWMCRSTMTIIAVDVFAVGGPMSLLPYQ